MGNGSYLRSFLANIITCKTIIVIDYPMEMVDVLSFIIILFSLGVFYWFGRFTQKLIKQHYDIYGLLYDMEEIEKNKK
ncbi:hypothetical protein GF326_03245 [Candidatus Bathyarchaeota archaeon]|nr:hypothetical protein [Candidatus Bathyarchaeota archaeon]